MYLKKGYKFQKIENQLVNVSTVTMDVFDTVLKRDACSPGSIFDFMERSISNEHQIANFAVKRRNAERKAYKLLGTKTTLKDIYLNLDKQISENEVKEFCAIEKQLEYDLCCVNIKIKHILDFCAEKKIQVILISDMYLESAFIKKMLSKVGIMESVHYDKIYVSSEYGMTKKSGTLYDLVIQENNIDLKRTIHIGDAVRSDFCIPYKKGLKAIHIPTEDICGIERYSIRDKSRTMEHLCKFQRNRIDLLNGEYQVMGYECLGPILYGFSCWLHEILEQNHAKIPLFFSREGQLLEKAYRIIFPESKTVYVHVSRQSLLNGILWMCENIESKLLCMTYPKVFSTKTVLELLGLENETDFKSERTYYSVSDVLKDINLLEFLRKKNKEIDEFSYEQYQYIKRIFSEYLIDNKLFIVDIGWNGTMQKYLQKIMQYSNSNNEVIGIYVGTKDSDDGLIKYGYLFDGNKNRLAAVRENDVFSLGGLLECLFTADHGSVKKYICKENEISPLFSIHELSEFNEYKLLYQVQSGALKFVEDFNKSVLHKFIAMRPEIAYAKMHCLGNYPSKEQIALFEDFIFYDHGYYKMCGSLKLFDCLKEPKKCKDDFMCSGWKVGWIKRVCFILPAHFMYYILKKMEHIGK